MNMVSLYGLKDRLDKDGILICFSGPFSHSIIEELGHAVKKYMESEQASRAAMMDVFSIFIELTQNVRNYATRKEADGNRNRDFNSGIIVIGKSEETFIVSSGNFMLREDLQAITENIDALKTMTPEELKSAWKTRIRQETPPGATGAGLGLIDMARKTSRPLEYSISELGVQDAFFSIMATI